jgi:hypothetical protein
MTQKYHTFMEWCAKVGVISDKVEFPATFDGGLIGVRAKEDIKHREMIMSIPYNILFTVDKAREDPVIGKLLKDNDTLFGSGNPDAD